MRERNRLVTALLTLAVVAVLAASYLLAPRPSDPDAEAFAGTDSVVTEMLAADGTEPWFEPLFQPNSGELESGLFAMQAAAGAGLLGFALGSLHGRRARPATPAQP